MDQRPPSTEGATPVDDDIALDMTRVLGNAPLEAPETPASAIPSPSAPLTRTERLRASMRADLDKAQAEYRILLDQEIQIEEIDAVNRAQAEAEYAQAIADAKATMEGILASLTGNKEKDMAKLDAKKADVLGIIETLTSGLEGGAK